MRVKERHRSGTYNSRAVLVVFFLAAGILTAYWLLPGPAQVKNVAVSTINAKQGESTMVTVCVMNAKGELTKPITMPKVVRTEEEWKKRLTPEQYYVTRNSGTERAFCGNLLDNKKEGVYTCVCCGLPLFASNAKFDSGTGWPSFFQPICKENVLEIVDNSHGMTRTEINCARCDGHLGHVFDDGPRDKTGLRFCLNSESLEFTEKGSLSKLADPAAK